MIKILNNSNFQVDECLYSLSDLERRIDIRANGANIHRLRNNIACVGGYFNLIRDGYAMTEYEKLNFKKSLSFILKNIR